MKYSYIMVIPGYGANLFDVEAVTHEGAIDVLDAGMLGADARAKARLWAQQFGVPLKDKTVPDLDKWRNKAPTVRGIQRMRDRAS